jgi:hypothetical protein
LIYFFKEKSLSPQLSLFLYKLETFEALFLK